MADASDAWTTALADAKLSSSDRALVTKAWRDSPQLEGEMRVVLARLRRDLSAPFLRSLAHNLRDGITPELSLLRSLHDAIALAPLQRGSGIAEVEDG